MERSCCEGCSLDMKGCKERVWVWMVGIDVMEV